MRIVRSKATRVSDTGKPHFRPLARTMQAAQRLGYRKRIWQLGVEKTMADLMGNYLYLIYVCKHVLQLQLKYLVCFLSKSAIKNWLVMADLMGTGL